MTLRKTFSALAAVLLGVVVVAVALAGNTNFTKTSACWTTISTGTCTTSSGATTAALASTSFDATTAVAPTSQIPTEVFLHGVFSGTGQGGNFTLTGNGAIVYGCVNGGVKNPSASNKEFLEVPIQASAQVASRNGKVNGDLLFSPPSAASVLTCPSGQVASVLEAHATKLIITNTNNGDSASVPDADVVYLAT
jgi:hypothetical protein